MAGIVDSALKSTSKDHTGFEDIDIFWKSSDKITFPLGKRLRLNLFPRTGPGASAEDGVAALLLEDPELAGKTTEDAMGAIDLLAHDTFDYDTSSTITDVDEDVAEVQNEKEEEEGLGGFDESKDRDPESGAMHHDSKETSSSPDTSLRGNSDVSQLDSSSKSGPSSTGGYSAGRSRSFSRSLSRSRLSRSLLSISGLSSLAPNTSASSIADSYSHHSQSQNSVSSHLVDAAESASGVTSLHLSRRSGATGVGGTSLSSAASAASLGDSTPGGAVDGGGDRSLLSPPMDRSSLAAASIGAASLRLDDSTSATSSKRGQGRSSLSGSDPVSGGGGTGSRSARRVSFGRDVQLGADISPILPSEPLDQSRDLSNPGSSGGSGKRYGGGSGDRDRKSAGSVSGLGWDEANQDDQEGQVDGSSYFTDTFPAADAEEAYEYDSGDDLEGDGTSGTHAPPSSTPRLSVDTRSHSGSRSGSRSSADKSTPASSANSSSFRTTPASSGSRRSRGSSLLATPGSREFPRGTQLPDESYRAPSGADGGEGEGEISTDVEEELDSSFVSAQSGKGKGKGKGKSKRINSAADSSALTSGDELDEAEGSSFVDNSFLFTVSSANAKYREGRAAARAHKLEQQQASKSQRKGKGANTGPSVQKRLYEDSDSGDDEEGANATGFSSEEEEEEEEEEGVRRSRRATKGQRLAFWKGERPLYQQGTMVGLLTAAPTPAKAKAKAKAKARARQQAQQDREDGRGGGEVEDGQSQQRPQSQTHLPPVKLPRGVRFLERKQASQLMVWDYTGECESVMRVFCAGETLRPASALPRTNKRPPGRDRVGYAAHSFNVPEIAGTMSGWISGFVDLPPEAIKDAESVGKYAQVFVVADCQDGALELGVAHPRLDVWDDQSAQRLLLRRGDSFVVPPGNIYRLENHSAAKSCMLYWTIIKPLDSNLTPSSGSSSGSATSTSPRVVTTATGSSSHKRIQQQPLDQKGKDRAKPKSGLGKSTTQDDGSEEGMEEEGEAEEMDDDDKDSEEGEEDRSRFPGKVVFGSSKKPDKSSSTGPARLGMTSSAAKRGTEALTGTGSAAKRPRASGRV